MADRICSVDDCERPFYGRGYCQRHYALWRRNGTPEKVKVKGVCTLTDCQAEHYGRGLCRAHWLEHRRVEAAACKENDCEDRVEARGWCSRHYNRWKRHGDAQFEVPPKLCSIEGCGARHNSNGWCWKHAERNRKYGDPLFEWVYQPPPPKPCAVDDCDDDAYCREYCRDHYTRFRTYGDATYRRPWEWLDGCRICPRCERDVPRSEWAGPWCRPCKADYQNDRGHRRRARERATSVGPKFTRTEVFDRDGWVCQICGDPIPTDAKYPAPLSPSLDHIIPISRGGPHSLENTQASHLTCNLRKHASIGTAATAPGSRG